jgi:aerobic-type carbon monoxide dehydrogenase small subunit (CoxS/CutS family)
VLAIDAQGKKIETIEGLAVEPKLHPVCKPLGSRRARAATARPALSWQPRIPDRNPNPTPEQIKKGLGGNLCRCGTYMGIKKAVLQAAKEMQGGRNA